MIQVSSQFAAAAHNFALYIIVQKSLVMTSLFDFSECALKFKSKNKVDM